MWLRRKARWRNKDHLLELLESLSPVQIGDDYTEENRARDFIAVFSSSSDGEQGRRVLSQIASICDPKINPGDADKHGTLAFKMGMRRVMQQIQLCFVIREAPFMEGWDDGPQDDG